MLWGILGSRGSSLYFIFQNWPPWPIRAGFFEIFVGGGGGGRKGRDYMFPLLMHSKTKYVLPEDNCVTTDHERWALLAVAAECRLMIYNKAVFLKTNSTNNVLKVGVLQEA